MEASSRQRMKWLMKVEEHTLRSLGTSPMSVSAPRLCIKVGKGSNEKEAKNPKSLPKEMEFISMKESL